MGRVVRAGPPVSLSTSGSPTRNEYEAIVVGLGGIGSGAAYWLARRFGDRVLGLEQFAFGHVNGASQDHGRHHPPVLPRPHYVRLAAQAYEAWSAVEAEWGRPLIVRTGGLDLLAGHGDEDHDGRLHGRHGRLRRALRAPRRG